MISFFVTFGSFYWSSGLGLIVTLIIISPIIIWQFVKRLPTRKRVSSRRRGKKNVRS